MNTEEYDTIRELIYKFQADNPEANLFRLPKAIIGSKLNYNINKQGKFCKEIAYEYSFIKDTKGFLEIDIKGFTEWDSMIQERDELGQKNKEIVEKFHLLEETLQKGRAVVSNNEKELKALEDDIKKVQNRIQETEDMKPKLKEQIDYLKAEHEQKTKELEPYRIEISELSEKCRELRNRLHNAIESSNRFKNWHNRDKKDYILYQLNELEDILKDGWK